MREGTHAPGAALAEGRAQVFDEAVRLLRARAEHERGARVRLDEACDHHRARAAAEALEADGAASRDEAAGELGEA
jgi:hypothetical protein